MSRSTALTGLCLILALAAFSPAAAGAPDAARSADLVETVVLSEKEDPYYPLAEEIADGEELPLVHNWAEAAERGPLTILWVVAPERLSDPVMARAGLALKTFDALPAVGIISGESLDEAGALWERGQQARALDGGAASASAAGSADGGRYYIANGEHASAGQPEPRLVAFTGGGPEPASQPLTSASLYEALLEADYMAFNGHGAARYLRIDEDTKITAADLPDLPPLVVSTSACQTMRPWEEGSIAMAFTRRGAAAYAGFVYSPNTGYLLGEFRALPFGYTWPGFPIGRVMALQTRGTLKSYAAFPFHYLLGDPRIALNDQPPYTLLEDVEQNGQRVLSYSAVEAGLVPVRVPGGAEYTFVDIPAANAASAMGDFFFNSRLQMLDARGDKYILFEHPGGPFRITLRRSAPWHWFITRPLLDSYDDLVLFTPQNGGGEIMIAAGALLLAVGLLRAWKRQKTRAGLGQNTWQQFAVTVLGIGLGSALAYSVYACLRLPHAAVVTKPLDFSPAWMIGAGLLTWAGALLYSTARRRAGRIIAVLATALPALLPALFMFGAVAYINLIASQQIGASIYSYRLALIPLPAAAVTMLVMWGLFEGLVRRKG